MHRRRGESRPAACRALKVYGLHAGLTLNDDRQFGRLREGSHAKVSRELSSGVLMLNSPQPSPIDTTLKAAGNNQ